MAPLAAFHQLLLVASGFTDRNAPLPTGPTDVLHRRGLLPELPSLSIVSNLLSAVTDLPNTLRLRSIISDLAPLSVAGGLLRDVSGVTSKSAVVPAEPAEILHRRSIIDELALLSAAGNPIHKAATLAGKAAIIPAEPADILHRRSEVEEPAHLSGTDSTLPIISSLTGKDSVLPNLPKLPKGILSRSVQVQTSRLQAFQDPAPDHETANYINLTRKPSTARSSGYLNAMRKPQYPQRQGVAEISPLMELGGVEYLTTIRFDNQEVEVIVDTGSSDTWLVRKEFQCLDVNSQSQPQSTCNFGPLYDGSFGAQAKADVSFSISYGDGEFVLGEFGYANITIAGITVPNQQAALANRAYWNGDSVSSGLLGLAYPDLTSQYTTTSTSNTNADRIPYDPLFTTMYKKNLSVPMFSMAIERSSGGYLAFGGLPPVTVQGPFAAVAIETMTARSGQEAYLFYTVTPDAFSYTGAPAQNTDQYIVDSGTTLFYASSSVAQEVNALFEPPATVSGGSYYVNCDAKAPKFAVKIGGQDFVISPQDMILGGGRPGVTCVSGIQDGGGGPLILGDVFMKNAVVVFDVGAAEMRFGARGAY